MTRDALTTERLDRVLVLHLDDGKANALSAELIGAIRSALAQAEDDDTIGAVVLHGREGRFCAGFDLGVMMGGDLRAVSSLVSDGGDLVAALYGASVPVVAACTGHALAAGALLLLGCDVRVGADVPAKIGLNEVAIKMVLPGWALTIAEERLSRRHLQRAIVNARVTGPAHAVDVGYLDEVVPADELLATAVARADELAATLDPAAYRGTITALRGPTLRRMAEQVAADRAAGSVPTA
ncbi:MAG: crotonase/enoyl-CoA hydratase family protein [Ilumatobacteraceae bacterium]|jgi:enoyl-CoA hydratase|nr:crotonase/enoyl-CoA hydratase family protein [Ilumatobacteraceae bacterium]